MESLKLEHLIFDSAPADSIEQLFCSWLSDSSVRSKYVVTPNPEMFISSMSDDLFADFLRSADLRVVDSAGIQYAFVAMNNKRVHKNTGVETLDLLAQACVATGKKLLLVGSENDNVVQRAVADFRRRFPGLIVEGISPGVVREGGGVVEFNPSVLDSIRSSSADAVALGLGMRKQEFAMPVLSNILPSAKIFIGVGGAIDMAAGKFKRAPRVLRGRIGLEWLWRLALQPSRWRRILTAAIGFPVVIIWYTLKRGIFLRSTLNFLRFIFS